LTYSNAPILEMLNIHIVEENPQVAAEPHDAEPDERREDPRRKSPYGMVRLENGSQLMPYEILINPPPVESNVLHWPWAQVKSHPDNLEALRKNSHAPHPLIIYKPL